jgi:hypothetical protein
MWIIQEPNKVELWNKWRFEEKRTQIMQHVLTVLLLLFTQSIEMRPKFQGYHGSDLWLNERITTTLYLIRITVCYAFIGPHRWHTLLMTYTVKWHTLLMMNAVQNALLSRFTSYFHDPRDVWFTFSIVRLLIRSFILLTRSHFLPYVTIRDHSLKLVVFPANTPL